MSESNKSTGKQEPQDEETVVIGREYAAALSAAQRHHETLEDGRPSPLEGVGYDFWAGHHDLIRLVAAPADKTVRSLITLYRHTENEGRAGIRSALKMDDFYTLLTFARRNAVRALRANDPGLAADAVTAAALIDSERVDWRDILWALGLTTYVLRGLTTDADAVIGRAQGMAEPNVGEMLSRFIAVSDEDADLAAWGYMQVETAAGVGFVERGIADYAPTVDLIDIALEIAEVIDGDKYRVSSISAADELAPVWLPGASQDEADLAVDACRGCVNVSARLEPDAHSDVDAQQFNVFLIEASNEADAGQLQDWAAPTDGSHQAVSVQHGPLLCLVIARSFVQDVEPFETADSLSRFFEPFDAIVATAVASA